MDYSFLPEEKISGITVKRYKIKASLAGQTDNPRVFVGGDAHNETKDAISAIGDGHAAALAIDCYLQKKGKDNEV